MTQAHSLPQMKLPISFLKTFLLTIALILLPNLVWSKVSESQVVAAVIIGEAGGEGQTGMLAVAGVIKNRMVKSRTAYMVVTRKSQFDAYTHPILYKKVDIDSWVQKAAKHPRWAYALELAGKLNNGTCQDITEGATHYHAASCRPYWAKVFLFKTQIGHHLFYLESHNAS